MAILHFLWQQLIDAPWTEELIKLIIAAVLGFLMGIERESRERAAGVRTYMLIAIGACSMMIFARYIIEDLFALADASSTLRIDPGRIPSYAIASMGFMGAGVIYKKRGSIEGITTAAGMWVITIIGLTTGAGYYRLAITTTLLSLLTLFLLRLFTKSLFHKNNTTLIIISEDRKGQLGKIKDVIQKYSYSKIEDVKYEKQIQESGNIFLFQVSFPAKKNINWEEVDKELEALGGIKEITMEEGDYPAMGKDED